MSERMKQTITTILTIVVFIVCIALVITGQRNAGAKGTGIMLLGLAGLIGLLWNYNRKFK